MSNTLNLGDGKWATKEGSLLAYNSENKNYKPLPFSFDRASSATVVNKEGLIETVGSGEPRIDYKDDSKGALLLEPSRTNLVTQSNNTTESAWSHYSYGGGLIVDTYGYPSPNGKNEASRLVYTNSSLGSGGALLTTNISLLATGVYTISLWAKSVSGTKEIRFSPKSSGSAGPVGSRVTLTNQWKRYTHTFTNDGGTNRGFQFRLLDSEDSGDRTFDVWGMTIEQGSFATSYIPTQGSIGTRVSDSCEQTPPDGIINSSEGVLMAEISALADDLTNRIISLSDGTNNNIISVQFANTQSNDIIAYYNNPSQTGRLLSTTSYNIKSFNKIALVWSNSYFNLYINGSLIGSSTIENPFSNGTLNELKFEYGNGTLPFKGNVKDLRVYNTALTDQELIALTTL